MPLSDSDLAASYKVLILGDASVGKTALLRRLTGRDFLDRLLPTIATDFVRRKFEVDGALVELQIWDTAGKERFHSVNKWQYRGVKGVVIVYDVTDKSTFTHLSYWIRSVNDEMAQTHNKYEAVPIVLLGNKCDLDTEKMVKTKEGRKLADKELAFEFFETSAKTGKNVFDAFRKLAYHVTDICDPDVMMSYYPNMIRARTFSPATHDSRIYPTVRATATHDSRTYPIVRATATHDSRTYPIVRANMNRNVVTIEWNTSTNDIKSARSFKGKPKKRKRKITCCCFK